MTKWIATGNGMPNEVRTESDTYTPISGEVSFNHNPLNSELNTAFPGRLNAINISMLDISYQFTTDRVLMALLSHSSGEQLEDIRNGLPFSESYQQAFVDLMQLKQDAAIVYGDNTMRAIIQTIQDNVGTMQTAMTSMVSAMPETFDDLNDGTTNKAFTATEQTKLAGIASSATANDTDANLKNRANHTGAQAISTVTGLQASLDDKAPLASPTFTGTVSGVTKSMVGLGNVDNTTDANKPVSTSTQTALNLKADVTALGKAYQGTTAKQGAFPIFKQATVSSNVAVFHLTNDGLSTGTALFPNGPIVESINAFVSDATASYQISAALSNSNKTVTLTVNKLTTANILTGILGQAAANASVVNLQVWGN